VVNERRERVPLGPGDKLILPAGAVHAEGEVAEKMVYIVGILRPENLLDALLPLLDPATSPLDFGFLNAHDFASPRLDGSKIVRLDR